jgi:uncharacterized protein (TIRG00374 family)
VGEVFKSLILFQTRGIPIERTAPIVVAERVTDLVALLVLAVIGVATYGVSPVLVTVATGLVGFGLVLLAWPRPARWLIDVVTYPRFTRRFRQPLQDMYGGLASLCRPTLLVMTTALAVPAWACECIGFALIVNAFPGPEVPLGLAMTIYASTTIAGALSFLPGGLGVTESTMAILLVQAHVSEPVALDATLLARLATLWFGVLLGVVLLAFARGRIAKRQQANAT